MEIIIESTRNFEKDIENLSKEEKDIVIKKINDCANLFPTQKAQVYRKLHRLPLLSEIDSYDSSLYKIKISPKLMVILSLDEDPIFEQVIFTLFRVVQHNDFDKAYQDIAESLYQELFPSNRKPALIS